MKKQTLMTLIIFAGALAPFVWSPTFAWFFNFKKGAPKTQQERPSNTALHVAAAFQGLKEVDFAINELKIDINARDHLGRTALQVAAERGRTDMVKYIYNIGADLDLQDSAGDTALHTVVRKNNAELVKYLLSEWHPVWPKTSGRDKLPANTNIQNKDGNTALHIAVQNKNIPIIEKLIVRGEANIRLANNRGEAALDLAYKLGNTRITDLVDPTIINMNARTRNDVWDHHWQMRILRHKNSNDFDQILAQENRSRTKTLLKLCKTPWAHHTSGSDQWDQLDVFGDLAKSLLEYMSLFYEQPDIASEFTLYDGCLRSFFQALEKNRVSYHTKNGISMDSIASIERLKTLAAASFDRFKTTLLNDVKPYMLSAVQLLEKGPHWSPKDREERYYIPAQNLVPHTKKEREFLKKYLDTIEALHDKLNKATTYYMYIGKKLYEHECLTAPDECYSIDTEKLERACTCIEFIMQEKNQKPGHQERWQSRKQFAHLRDNIQKLILECGAKRLSYYKPYILHAVLFDALTALYEAFAVIKHTDKDTA